MQRNKRKINVVKSVSAVLLSVAHFYYIFTMVYQFSLDFGTYFMGKISIRFIVKVYMMLRGPIVVVVLLFLTCKLDRALLVGFGLKVDQILGLIRA